MARRNRKAWQGRGIAVLSLALVLLVSACGGDDDATGSDASDAPETTTATTADSGSTDTTAAAGDATTQPPAVVRSGSLTVGYVSTVDTLSPNPFGSRTFAYRDALYDPLLAIDEAGEPIPALAEAWTLSDDGLVLTLDLRDGVTYHDGTPFDAEAAKANIEWFGDPVEGPQGRQTWATVSAAVIDSDTLELTLPQPTPEIFALLDLALVSKPGAWDQGIGTGPFVLESHTPRAEIKLTANENYWDPALPKVEALVLREFADPASAGLVAEGGDIDILVGLQPAQVASLEAAGLSIVEIPTSGNYDILVNSTDAGITDARVRRALSLAFDRQRFADVIMLGYATPVSSIFAPASPVHEGPQEVTPFDLDAAAALLSEAGVSDLEITTLSPSILPTHNFLPIYQEDLAKIGVTLVIEPTDPASWSQAVAQPGSIPDTATHGYQFSDSDPALLFSAHPFRVTTNSSGFVSDEYEALVTAALAETDLAARYEAFRAVDAFIQEQAFVFPIVNPLGLNAVRPGVDGFRALRQSSFYEEVTVSDG